MRRFSWRVLSPQRKTALLFLGAGLIIAAGLMPSIEPINELARNTWNRASELTVLRIALALSGLSFFFGLYMLFVLPAGLALIALVTTPVERESSYFSVILLGFLLVVGIPLTAMMASGSSGPGAKFVFVEGLALMLAVTGAISLYRKLPAFDDISLFRIDVLCLSAASVIAMWSLAMIVPAATSAIRISDGNPYCIATHGREEINSIWGLRGLEFYTTRSHIITGWRPLFHGVMIVDVSGGRHYYNWSPRHLRFDQIPKTGNLYRGLEGSCQPVEHFLRRWSMLF